uniref:hypothetical protein n=1 Tax=unclassified Streptomyces TaxID=2593676 RepID=UPI003F49A922
MTSSTGTVAPLTVGTFVVIRRPAFEDASTRPVGPGVVLANYPDPGATAAPVWFWGMGPITPGHSVRDMRPAEAHVLTTQNLGNLPVGPFVRIASELLRPLSAARPDVHPLARAIGAAAANRELWEFAAWLCQTCRTHNRVIREEAPGACRVCGQL